MKYDYIAIPESEIPETAEPAYQHLVDTYVSEANKVCSIWKAVPDRLLSYKPHEASNDVQMIMKHQLLSERRFFAQFVGTSEPEVDTLLPRKAQPLVADYLEKYLEQIHGRLPQIAVATPGWWLEEHPFFGFQRQRIWTFWRRVLHTCHHRTQIQTYLRLAGEKTPAIYGPSGDVTWEDADPTYSTAAAQRS